MCFLLFHEGDKQCLVISLLLVLNFISQVLSYVGPLKKGPLDLSLMILTSSDDCHLDPFFH